MNSNHTGRFPRTLQAAFGPYARWDVERRAPFWRRHAIALSLVLFFVTIGASLVVQLAGRHA